MMLQKKSVPTIVGFWTTILLLWTSMLCAAPDAKLIPFWSNASNESNSTTIDHTTWQTILDHYLDANHPSNINRFNYAGLKANATDTQKLVNYLASLKKLDPRRYSKVEQKAYWINLYNALTVQVVLDNFPLKSIKKIGWFGPWNKNLIEIRGQSLSLNNIEHGILRPIWNDNRIHYAVNCASIGCPNLATKAYTAANTEKLLEKAAKDYVNHPRGVQCGNRKLQLSSIYDWYKVDFASTNNDVIKHLLKYAKPNLAKCLHRYQGSIDYEYNWNINLSI